MSHQQKKNRKPQIKPSTNKFYKPLTNPIYIFNTVLIPCYKFSLTCHLNQILYYSYLQQNNKASVPKNL